jgi:hypothetical protein
MNRYVLYFFVLCAVSSIAASQSEPSKTPAPAIAAKPVSASNKRGAVGRPVPNGWEITDEERIAGRVHPAPLRAESSNSSGAPTNGYREAVNGSISPHLLMPYELFDHLLLALSSDTKLAQRAHTLFDPKVRAFGYDDKQFWATLGSTSGPYLRGREEHERRHQRTAIFRLPDGRESFVIVNRDDCAARLVALQNTRQHLGNREFDRFLYSMIAPDFKYSEGGTAPDRAAQLRYMAKGCK